MPAGREQKGFRSILVASDAETGETIVVSLWDSKKDMEAGESSSYCREQIAKLGDTLAGPPVREAYEVNIQE